MLGTGEGMNLSKKMTLLVDLMTMIFSYTPSLTAFYFTFWILLTFDNLMIRILLFPFLVQLLFVVTVFAIRLLLPRLEPGVYKTGLNKGFFTWYAHSMLTRSARCFGLHYLLHCTSTMRWFYWRALGVNVPLNINTSYKVTIHDAQVLSIGAGTVLAEDVELSGHLVRGDKVLVAPVKIGTGVFLGRGTYVGPRTRIGHGAWIGMNNILSGKVIAEKQVVKSHELSEQKQGE